MLKERLVIGILGAIVAIVVLLAENVMLSLCVAAITLLALGEFYNAQGYFKKNLPLALFGFAVSLIALFAVMNGTVSLIPLLMGYIAVLFVYMVLTYGRTGFKDVAMSFFATVYITLMLAHIVLLRRAEDGRVLVWLVFIGAWLTDTSAYTFGLLFGRHKLIEAVSPKKTVEGAVGGVIGNVASFAVFGLVCSKALGYTVNWAALLALGVIAAVAAQFGDLAASCIKRETGIKDFGSLLPGHGGVMDRFDSVLLVAPAVYYFVTHFHIFV